jgi:hypothetical protein
MIQVCRQLVRSVCGLTGPRESTTRARAQRDRALVGFVILVLGIVVVLRAIADAAPAITQLITASRLREAPPTHAPP